MKAFAKFIAKLLLQLQVFNQFFAIARFAPVLKQIIMTGWIELLLDDAESSMKKRISHLGNRTYQNTCGQSHPYHTDGVTVE